MYILLFAVAVAAVMAVLQYRQYLAFRRLLDEHAQATGQPPRATPLPPAQRAALAVPILICAGAAVYILAVPDAVPDPPAWLTLLAVLAILFASSLITCPMTQCLYYTDEGFFLRDRFIPFAQLQKISHGRRKADTIELRDGSAYPLPRRQCQALEELRAQGAFRLRRKRR